MDCPKLVQTARTTTRFTPEGTLIRYRPAPSRTIFVYHPLDRNAEAVGCEPLTKQLPLCSRRSEHATHESTPASGGASQTVQALIDQVAGTAGYNRSGNNTGSPDEV